MTRIPRGEYPRPQFMREDWLCLNGEWQFEIDQGDSGLERGLLDRALTDKIIVPFCPESNLSGVENRDFLNAVWYRREVTIPQEWSDKRVLLHFQAVDYDTTVWVNGDEVGRHRGGFTPFSCELHGIAQPGDTITVVVRARDDNASPKPRGKQAKDYDPSGAIYVRTTGIWQTVWMEPVPHYALKRPRITPDLANRLFRLEQPLSHCKPGLRLRVSLQNDGENVSTVECPVDQDFTPHLDLIIPEKHLRLWSPEDPHLYTLEIELLDTNETVIDRMSSYAGLRALTINDKAIKINGEVVFQRLVLDQGYYPDGVMTAPSDGALKQDIELSIEAGFNGARLHQKVFEERFLYHADTLGYIVWGEFGDWGNRFYGPSHGEHQRFGPEYITQWLEVLERDYSHPSIVGWCPLNETWQVITDNITALDDATYGMFMATKAMDTTRPVLDASGYSHRVRTADVYDSHDYTQDPEQFRKRHAGLIEGRPFVNEPPPRRFPPRFRGTAIWSIPYRGQPYFVSEFGGIWWNPDASKDEDSWGYGERPRTIEKFYTRFEKLCAILLDNPYMFGYCYTQLTDIYQEQNGIYKFSRARKFDMERIRQAQQRPAAIEKLVEKQGTD